ncbi:MAG TPA: hypothetical protein VL096_02500, partial [Pirellulaceae bacterium]|nr:hypothetical protein [Pirellulaceae bacterium]
GGRGRLAGGVAEAFAPADTHIMEVQSPKFKVDFAAKGAHFPRNAASISHDPIIFRNPHVIVSSQSSYQPAA